jgi:integrase
MSRQIARINPEQQHIALVAKTADAHAAAASMAEYRQQRADNTIARQNADLDAFAVFLSRLKIDRTAEELATRAGAWRGITFGVVKAFVGHQLQLGFAVRTVNGRLSTVKVYAELAAQSGAITPGELAMIKTVKGYSKRIGTRIDKTRTQTRVSTKKEEANVLDEAQALNLRMTGNSVASLRNAVMIMFMLDMGLRVGEVVMLTIEGLDLSVGTIRFYRPKVDITQNQKLPRDLRDALKRYSTHLTAKTGPLIRQVENNGKLSMLSLSRISIFKVVRAIGIGIGIDNLSPHDLRHTWATREVQNGTTIDRLQDAGGWSNPSTPLKVYVKPSQIANQGTLATRDEAN